MKRSIILASVVGALVGSAPAQAVPVKVTPFAQAGWSSATNLQGNRVTYPTGPNGTWSGVGSVQLSAGPGAGGIVPRVTLRTGLYNGAALSSFNRLEYMSHTLSTNGNSAPYLGIEVDNNDDGMFDDTLVFSPALQPGGVKAGSWQFWDTLAGVWWSTKANAGMGQNTPAPLATYLEAYPTAKVVFGSSDIGGLGFTVGDSTNTTSQSGNVDFLNIEAGGAPYVVFNFDPLF